MSKEDNLGELVLCGKSARSIIFGRVLAGVYKAIWK